MLTVAHLPEEQIVSVRIRGDTLILLEKEILMDLNIVEKDLVLARDNADRSAQTRLFMRHVPEMIRQLRALEPVVEVEEVVAEEEEDAALEEDVIVEDEESEEIVDPLDELLIDSTEIDNPGE